MALEVFIDDSGKPDHSPVFVLAGYVAKVDRWEAFAEKWSEVCAAPPSIGYYKSSEARRMGGQFRPDRGFDRDKRDAKQVELVKTINRHVLGACAVVVRFDDYSSVMGGVFKGDFWDRPYFVALYKLCTMFVRLTEHLGILGRIDFTFDMQSDEPVDFIRSEFAKFVSLAPPSIRERFGSRPSFRDDTEVVALQAADMLAWHVRRGYGEMEKGVVVESDDPSNVYLANLLNQPYILHPMKQSEIIAVRDAMLKKKERPGLP